MKHRWTLILPLLIFPLTGAKALPSYKVETIGACTNTEVAEAVRKSLKPEGYRVTGDSGVLCELWFRSLLPQKAGSSGTNYNTLAAGTFVGVITYPGKGGDFRGQAIRSGTYTLRYQTIPGDGNHLGVSPTPDFFLLIPASADKDPEAVIDYPELVKLSKQASGTNHPQPLNLTSPTGGPTASFRETGDSHGALEARTKAKPAGGGAEVDFPLAVIVIGKAEG